MSLANEAEGSINADVPTITSDRSAVLSSTDATPPTASANLSLPSSKSWLTERTPMLLASRQTSNGSSNSESPASLSRAGSINEPSSMPPTPTPSFQRIRETKDAIIKRTPLVFRNASVNAFQSDPRGPPYGSIQPPDPSSVSPSASASISRYKYYNKLAPFRETPFVMPDHVVPVGFFIVIPIKRGEGQNSIVTIFSIWNTMMGTSILALPWAITKAGFSTGIAIVLLMGLLTYYTCYLIVKTTSEYPCRPGVVVDFPDICEYYLGKFGKWTCFAFNTIAFLGALIVYWVLMTNFLFNTGKYAHDSLTAKTNTSSKVQVHCEAINLTFDPNMTDLTNSTSTLFHEMWNLQNTCPFWLLLLVFPLINLKSATFFTKFNVLGTFSILYLFFFVFYHAVKWGPCVKFDQSNNSVVEFSSSFPALCGTLSLAMFIHNGVMAILRNQKKPQNNTRDLSIAYILVTITYMFVGVVFYVAFPHYDKNLIPDNFLNFFPPNDVFSVVARAFLLLQMVCVFPLLIYILRIQVMHTFFNSVWPSLYHVLIFNAFLLGICATVACLYPSVGDIIRYAGSLCGLALVFTLPSLVHMLKLREDEKLTWEALAVHVGLILFGVAVFVSQFFV